MRSKYSMLCPKCIVGILGHPVASSKLKDCRERPVSHSTLSVCEVRYRLDCSLPISRFPWNKLNSLIETAGPPSLRLPVTPIIKFGARMRNMRNPPICQSCRNPILEGEGETWHYRYNGKAGLLEPVHDKCDPESETPRGHQPMKS